MCMCTNLRMPFMYVCVSLGWYGPTWCGQPWRRCQALPGERDQWDEHQGHWSDGEGLVSQHQRCLPAEDWPSMLPVVWKGMCFVVGHYSKLKKASHELPSRSKNLYLCLCVLAFPHKSVFVWCLPLSVPRAAAGMRGWWGERCLMCCPSRTSRWWWRARSQLNSG